MDPGSFTLDETIEHAADLTVRAHDLGIDVGEWFALVAVRAESLIRSRIQGQPPSVLAGAPDEVLLSNRPGSWEADLIRRLMQGTGTVD